MHSDAFGEHIDRETIAKENTARLTQMMQRHDLDGVVINSTDNFRWLTGIPVALAWYYRHSHTAVLSKDSSEPVIIALEGNEDVERSWFKDVRSLRFYKEIHQPMGVSDWPSLCACAVKDCGLSGGRIGLDPELPFVLKEALAHRLPNTDMADAYEVLRDARLIKGKEEVKAIRTACIIGEVGMKAALDTIEEGTREREVAAAAVHAFISCGAERPIETPYVVSGKRPFMVRASEKRIRHDELVRVDLGCVYAGYHSDFSRTVYLGEPPREVQDLYRALLEAHLAGIETVRPGVTNAKVYEVVKSKLSDQGYELGWFLGHGLGVGVHEEPIFGDARHADELELKEGMYFCLEPSIMTRHGSMAIEDDLVVTESGAEVLTRTERGARILSRN